MIKMRINKNKESICFNCHCIWKNTPEMYDLSIGFDKQRILPLCQNCLNEIFKKSLKASCNYNARIKSKEDMQRIMNYNKSKGID